MVKGNITPLDDDVLEGVAGGYDGYNVAEWICPNCNIGLWLDQKAVDNAPIIDGVPQRLCGKCGQYSPIKLWN